MDEQMMSNDMADQIADSLAEAFNVGLEDIMELNMLDDVALLDTIKEALGEVGVETQHDSVNGEGLRRLLIHFDKEGLFPFSLVEQ